MKHRIEPHSIKRMLITALGAIGLLFPLPVANQFRCLGSDLRVVRGQHIHLTTDIPQRDLSNADHEDLVQKFDAATVQWCQIWGVADSTIAEWRIDAFLMRDVEPFRSRGDLPASVPRIRFGYASPNRIWVRDQMSTYYNRHLLLHEGVHSLAIHLFGGCGPTWYMEGTAEWWATHRDVASSPTISDSGLLAQVATPFQVRQLPRDVSESPLWGRFRVVEEHRRAATLPSLRSVMALPRNLEGDVESYTWAWAAAMMLNSYDDTRDDFIEAARRGHDGTPGFTVELLRRWQRRWPVLQARWTLMLHDLQYGFDWNDQRVDVSVQDRRYDGGTLITQIDPRRSWQSIGVWFPARTRLELTATGVCELESFMPMPVPSEPPGVTVDFADGRPIGQLSVLVLPIKPKDSKTLSPIEIEAVVPSPSAFEFRDADKIFSGRRLQINQPSWVLFRVEDPVRGGVATSGRASNRGGYSVTLSATLSGR
ncbi:MAG: hypothetical protein AAF745_07740 [Planctomycetota bacterium]